MSVMKSSPSVCPVPFEQQPINEYNTLKESWFFRWGTLASWRYLRVIGILWAVGWLVTGPIASYSFAPAKYPIQFGLSASAGALFMPALALIQLYLGWCYVRNRLQETIIPYEETGWYDGQSWQKPAEMEARDRLIVAHQVRPILKRLEWTFASMGLTLLLGAFIWQFL